VLVLATVERLVVDGGRAVVLGVVARVVDAAAVVVGTVVVGTVVVGTVVVGAVTSTVAATVSDVPRTDGFGGRAVEIDRSPIRPKRTTSSRTGTIARAKKARRPFSSVDSSAFMSIGAHDTRRNR
jgi:hypothetical protein